MKKALGEDLDEAGLKITGRHQGNRSIRRRHKNKGRKETVPLPATARIK